MTDTHEYFYNKRSITFLRFDGFIQFDMIDFRSKSPLSLALVAFYLACHAPAILGKFIKELTPKFLAFFPSNLWLKISVFCRQYILALMDTYGAGFAVTFVGKKSPVKDSWVGMSF